MKSLIVCLIVVTLSVTLVVSKKYEKDKKPAWAKKDIRDFDDADLERLFDQWEEDEEPLPADELPEHLRPPSETKSFPFDKVGSLSPDEIMKMTKKGKSVMMFINVDGAPTRDQTDTLTSLWQSALRNNHIQAERYVIEDNRAIFMFNDGSQAWDAKEFLLEQEGLLSITLEGQTHNGRKVKGPVPEKDQKKEL
ncbi:unnamed protein product [Allacma fusca]|uniref:LDLR chaperone boca n=1 Tax=Allacma fusca TaxID=39272 RepID=A0A8J2KIC3_9HEXA|nr:unnamed protein product [Allacma fusca]